MQTRLHFHTWKYKCSNDNDLSLIDMLTCILSRVLISGQQVSDSAADSSEWTKRWFELFLFCCLVLFQTFRRFLSLCFNCKTCSSSVYTLLPTIPPHLFINCPLQYAAQSFLTQEAAGTVSPSGTTTPINRTAYASTTVAAPEMTTDLKLRMPVKPFAVG